jgi:RHS repeat-associated protein
VSGGEPAAYTTAIERDAQGRPVRVSEFGELAKEEGESPADAPSNTTPAAIWGSAQQGLTLTASTGRWSGTPTISYVYQWRRCNSSGASCSNISAATASTYALESSDVGTTIRVVVTATNTAGSASSTSEPTAVVAGPPAADDALRYSAQFGSEGTGDGQFNVSGDVAIDAKGDLWVLDSDNGRIEEFSDKGEYLRSVGTEGSGPGELLAPSAIAIDSKGDLWVADTGNSRVDEFNEDGEYVKTVGAQESLFEEEEVGGTEGIAVDSHDDIWVSATYKGHLVVFNNNGEYLKTVGSSGSEPGQLGEPEGIAIDPHDNAWVADYSNDRATEYNENGEYVRQVGSEGSGDGQFEAPYGIATDSDGSVWVGDVSNDRVEEFNETGEYLQQLGSEGAGAGELRLGVPMGLAIGGADEQIWVTDSFNDRVEEWAPGGAPSNTALPSIFGEAVEGETLHASPGVWEGVAPVSYAYQWRRCNESGEECENIIGATGTSYTLTSSDAKAVVEVSVTATDTPGSQTATSAATSIIDKPWSPANSTAPAISGTAVAGHTLSVSTGSWTSTPASAYSYQWQRCNSSGASCSNISAATNSTYIPGSEDTGHTLRSAVTATNTAGSSTSTSAATGVVTGPRTTKYAYDADGDVEGVTSPDGNTTTYTYDADDEPIKVQEPNGDTTETEYNSEGQVVAQTDANKHTTKYTRNPLGEVTEVIDPLGHKTTKEYDTAGNLTSLTDPAKRTTTYTYDVANELTEINYSDGKTPDVKYEYNADGERTKMTDGTGTTKYTYDQLARLTETKDGHGDTVAYEYNLADQPTKITYPNGKAVTRTYDEDGRLHGVTDWLERTTTFSYDPDSDLTAIAFPSGSGEEDTYAYDDDEISEVKMSKGSETLASLAYTRDQDGQITNTISKGLPGEEETPDTYDANGRLTRAATTSYEYDAANNPTKIGSSSNTHNEADELEKTSSASYEYDELDERTKTTPTSGSATSYSYDQAGNLTSVARTEEGETPAIEDTYAYNGEGLRASETVGGTTSYLTWDTTEELPLILNDDTNSYIYGRLGMPIEQINNSTGTVEYLHHDQQGSTRLLTGSTGTITGKCTYSAYGTPTCEGTATTPLGYDAQYTSTDTGLIYLRNRVYDPSTAQFLTRDPLAAISGEPYSYAGDNPVNYGDPTGLLFGISLPSWEEVGEGIAGWGDKLTFGATKWVREQIGDENVDTCSGAYQTGGYAGLATTFFVPGEDEVEGAELAETGANDLSEQLALEEAQAGAGTRIMEGQIGDPAYPEDVWAKMQHVHENPDGSNTVIHYWENLETGLREEFKFK